MSRIGLINAARNGDLEAVKRLTSTFKNQNAIETAFIEASSKGYLPIVEYLYENYKPFSFKALQRAMLMSFSSGNLPLIEYLTSRTETYGKYDHLRMATVFGPLSVVKYILDDYDDYYDTSLLSIAARSGQLPILKYLVSLGYEISASDFLAAVRSGNLDNVKYLQSLISGKNPSRLNRNLKKGFRGIDNHEKLDRAMDIAIENNSLPIVGYFLSLDDYQPSSEIIKNGMKQYNPEIPALLLGILGDEISPSDFLFNAADPHLGLDEQINWLLAAAKLIPHNEKEKKVVDQIPEKAIKDGEKLIAKMQAQYLAPKVLDICTSLRHLSLEELLNILNNTVKYALNIPHHIKANMLEDCKHFGESDRKTKGYFR